MLDADLVSEGDVNLSPQRRAWQERNIGPATRQILAADADVFLHQSLSTPCSDVVVKCEGIYLYTHSGKKIIDFHGNSVHQVGHANPRVIAAITEQLGRIEKKVDRYDQYLDDLDGRVTELEKKSA